MSKVLLFGGTTEGRTIAEILSENKVECDVCVATEYGEMVMEELPFVHVKQGRLDAGEMSSLVRDGGYDAVIDATHPFAVEVSANIRRGVGAASAKLPLIRFERDTKLNSCPNDDGDVVYFDEASSCAEALERTTGKVLLTTGSKELCVFCRSDTLRKRLVARVLPGLESVRLCYDAGLEGKQIIAMQGPFSEKMNRAVIDEYGISVLVMKESGKTGGADEKISAAKAAGIPCYVIRRPGGSSDVSPVARDVRGASCEVGGARANYRVVSTIGELCRVLGEQLSVPLSVKQKFFVTLAGIGMGSAESMTAAVRARLAEADCVFGAPRMLESAGVSAPDGAKCANGTCATYPYYLAKDILPVLKEMLEKPPHGKTGVIRAVVLFSGDPGFFSGAEKLKAALSALPDTKIEVLPGISSIQYLASKLGRNWQNAVIISMHGVSEQEWLPAVKSAVEAGRETFFLTSGAADIRRLGGILVSLRQSSHGAKNVPEYDVHVGYQLSYPDEAVKTLTPEECLEIDGAGLWCGMLIPKKGN